MRIALLFYGQPRFIEHTEIYQSYKKNQRKKIFIHERTYSEFTNLQII